MATIVTLKIKDDQGNITKQQHEIEDINLIQFEQMLKVIKEIFQELQKDTSLVSLLDDMFGGKGNTGESNQEDVETNMDMQFVQKAIGSFDTLAVKMPAQAFKLLSVLSGVDIEILRQQKVSDVFDIFDAVIEENDIERLINRAKKSLVATVAKAKFLQLARKATTQNSVNHSSIASPLA